MVKQSSLLRTNPLFLRFWISRIASVIGSTFTRLAIPLEVLKQTESASLAALVTAISLAPILLLGIPAGAVADRSSRVLMMRIAEAASAIITVILGVIMVSAGFSSLPVLIAVGALSALAVFFDASSFGILPNLVPGERLGQANGLLYGNNTVISLVGPVVAGALYANFGIAVVLFLNAATFAVSLVFLLTLPQDRPVGGSLTEKLRSMPTDMAEGLVVIWRSSLLRYLVSAGAATGIAGGALNACIVVIASERFGGGGEMVGIFISSAGVGAFLASLLLSFLSERIPQSRITLVGLVAGLLSFLGIALAANPIMMAVFCVAWGLTYTVLIINNVTIRQSVLPDVYQARVNSTARTIAWGGEPVGAGLTVLLLVYLPDSIVLLIAAIPFLIATIVAPFTALKNRELTPVPVLAR